MSERDFMESPIWIWYAVDSDEEESGLDWDETFVTALEDKKIPKTSGTYIVSATITLADGTELPGALEVVMMESLLCGWQPVTIFWQSEYLGDFDPFPRTIQYLVSVLQRTESQIYPLTWTSNVPLEDTDIVLGGVISTRNMRGAHPNGGILSATTN